MTQADGLIYFPYKLTLCTLCKRRSLKQFNSKYSYNKINEMH